MPNMISIEDAIRYEVRASWWALHFSTPALQRLIGRYFAWKTRRKWGRYQRSMAELARVQA